jgi:hypothetical protein
MPLETSKIERVVISIRAAIAGSWVKIRPQFTPVR